uniref:Uncharacterized protein n=1 Tax=Magallana gigas TaxID=29159 RepID=K1PQM8_MAGGI
MTALAGVKSLNIQKTFQEDALVISWKSQLDKTQIDKEYVRYSSSVGLLKSWAVSRNSEIQIQDAINHDSVRLQIMQRYTNFSLAYFSFDIKTNKRFFREGETGTVSWTMTRYSENERYSIFHKNETIFKVSKQNARNPLKPKIIGQTKVDVGSEKIKSKFIAGNAEFSWSSVGDSEQSIFVTRNDDPGNWSDANQPYTVKDALNFSSIEVDVKILDSMKKEIFLCRGLFSGPNKRKPSTPIIESNLETPRYGNTLTLTCRSYSTSQPAYYRHQLTWSYTWYRNDSIVYRGHTYAFTVSRDVVYDEIMCQAKEVILSKNSSTYKIGYLEKSRPAEPKIVGISQTNAKYLRITWSSPFDGGYPQYFLIYQQTITVWDVVANISQSNATIQSADVPSGPKGVYGVAIMSCNMLGCTMPVKLDRESNAFLNDNGNSAGIAIGSSLAVIVLAIMVLLGLLHMKYGNLVGPSVRFKHGNKAAYEPVTKGLEGL